MLPNPTISAEAENFIGTGPIDIFRQAEMTVTYSQQMERGGKRAARVALAESDVKLAQAQGTQQQNLAELENAERQLQRYRAALKRLPGRKLILTNAPRAYTLRVMGALRLGGAFDLLVVVGVVLHGRRTLGRGGIGDPARAWNKGACGQKPQF